MSRTNNNPTGLTLPSSELIAERGAIIDELREIKYRKFRPLVFIGAGFGFIIVNDVIWGGLIQKLFFLQRVRLSVQITSLFLNEKQQAMLEVMSVGFQHDETQIRISQNLQQDFDFVSDTVSSVRQGVFFTEFLLYHIATYYFSKQLVVTGIERKYIQPIVRAANLCQLETAKANQKKMIELRKIRDEVKISSDSSFGLMLKAILFYFFGRCVIYAFPFANETGADSFDNVLKMFITLTVVHTLYDNFFINRQDKLCGKQVAQLHKQLNRITQNIGVQWRCTKRQLLKTTTFTLDLRDKEFVHLESRRLLKPTALKLLKACLEQHGCRIVTSNSNQGMVISRNQLFTETELSAISQEFTRSLNIAIEKNQHIATLLEKAKHLSLYYFDRSLVWHYFSGSDAVLLDTLDIGDIDPSLIADLEKVFGKGNVNYNQSSQFITVKACAHVNEVMYTSVCDSLLDKSTGGKRTAVKTQKPKSQQIKSAASNKPAAPIAINQPEIHVPNGCHLLRRPNVKVGKFVSRFDITNEGIMLQSGLFQKFNNVVIAGNMGGSGNRVVHLERHQQKKGYDTSGKRKTILATHKLWLTEDMRVYGHTEAQKDGINIVVFDTIMPKHKFEQRR